MLKLVVAEIWKKKCAWEMLAYIGVFCNTELVTIVRPKALSSTGTYMQLGAPSVEGGRVVLSRTASSLQPRAACWTPCVFSVFDHCLYLTSNLGARIRYTSYRWLLAIPCYICLLQGHCKTLEGLLVKIIGFLFGRHSKFSTSSPKLSKALSWSYIKPHRSVFKA